MKLTTKIIIKAIPWEQDYKIKLLNEWDTMDREKKFVIEGIVWETYRQLYEIKLAENLQLAFYNVTKRKENLDKNFYKRVRQKTDEDMKKEVLSNKESIDLIAARQAMEKIITEIRAAKGKKS
ncbi:hypothetical protein M1307_00935 [Patescibacteria group bacterium]|nr:hypothetical protein [Patescibacteria group bacterium]